MLDVFYFKYISIFDVQCNLRLTGLTSMLSVCCFVNSKSSLALPFLGLLQPRRKVAYVNMIDNYQHIKDIWLIIISLHDCYIKTCTNSLFIHPSFVAFLYCRPNFICVLSDVTLKFMMMMMMMMFMNGCTAAGRQDLPATMAGGLRTDTARVALCAWYRLTSARTSHGQRRLYHRSVTVGSR